MLFSRNFKHQIAVFETRRFNDNNVVLKEAASWSEYRENWAKNQKRIARNRQIFDKIYSEYYALKRESETEEIVVANGIFCDARNPSICHPIMTRRVKLDFDAVSNTMYICDSGAEPEIYTDVLKGLDGLNLQVINSLQEELIENDYHPLDRNDTPGFFKVLLRQLSSDSVYFDELPHEGWKRDNRFLIYNAPCFIVRRRQDGTVRAIEKINEAIEAGTEIPKALIDLVSVGKIDIPSDEKEYSIEEQLAMVGGESLDVLLSKEANREQLEIAQRIDDYNAVLVQGPPGTGKTHTIANLLGHFIAHGKSVLVTSHTTKALNVLKEKIAPGLQNLCVSLLDDSNKDMESSIEGITTFMNQRTSSSLRKELENIGEERKNIIASLAKVRKNIFMSIQKECESIVYEGESFTPAEAAKFVAQKQDELDYIPGKVKENSVLPLTFDELVELYRSNNIITETDDVELNCILPSPGELLTVSEFENLCQQIFDAESYIHSVNESGFLWASVQNDKNIRLKIFGREYDISISEKDPIKALKDYCDKYGEITPWQQAVAVDGKVGGGYRNRWENLIKQINLTNELSETLADKGLGKNVDFAEGIFPEDLLEPIKETKIYFDENGKLPFMFSVFHKRFNKALNSVRVSGKVPASSSECELVILTIEFQSEKKRCEQFWKELLVPHGVPEFNTLGVQPEREAIQYVYSIKKYLDWSRNDCKDLSNLLRAAGFPEDGICGISELDSEQVKLSKVLAAIHKAIPISCDVCMNILNLAECKAKLDSLVEIVIKDKRINSEIMQQVHRAIKNRNVELYESSIGNLADIYDKYDVLFKRNDYLKRLKPYAPDWAEAIGKREGMYGSDVLPSNIMDAWKWRQLSMLVDEITSTPISEYQAESRRLSKAYRRITAEYAEKSGWYQLLLRTETDGDLYKALKGWQGAVKKIGKGTGKRAPQFKAEARRLMVKCQKAVPAWIMPIQKAMDNLNPAKNIFDIVIVDEASQSDISALAILYMGKKIIIVGDDKQVSPMAVGIDVDEVQNLQQMYLLQDIPNRLMYDAQTSIYDIAMTTYHPLMLREHFRCVPEIIGYSNKLSYEGKILPLRAASSSNLLPAVVCYRVADGVRSGRKGINEAEARTIVALMKSCMEQPEYEGKTFGVISLL